MNLQESRDALRNLNGLYVGLLTGEELEALLNLEDAGEATRSYEGAGGLMGLAKIRLNINERDDG